MVELWNVRRKTDTIKWSLEKDGKVAETGTFGFPVVGTAQKLVYYRVDMIWQSDWEKPATK
jgi:hypothetical protein